MTSSPRSKRHRTIEEHGPSGWGAFEEHPLHGSFSSPGQSRLAYVPQFDQMHRASPRCFQQLAPLAVDRITITKLSATTGFCTTTLSYCSSRLSTSINWKSRLARSMLLAFCVRQFCRCTYLVSLIPGRTPVILFFFWTAKLCI